MKYQGVVRLGDALSFDFVYPIVEKTAELFHCIETSDFYGYKYLCPKVSCSSDRPKDDYTATIVVYLSNDLPLSSSVEPVKLCDTTWTITQDESGTHWTPSWDDFCSDLEF